MNVPIIFWSVAFGWACGAFVAGPIESALRVGDGWSSAELCLDPAESVPHHSPVAKDGAPAPLPRGYVGYDAADLPDGILDDWTVGEVPDTDTPTSVVRASLPEGGVLLLLGSGAALILARHRLPRRRVN